MARLLSLPTLVLVRLSTKTHLVGHAEFRDDAALGVGLTMAWMSAASGCVLVRLQHDQRQRTFAPLLVLDADHRDFGDRRMRRR